MAGEFFLIPMLLIIAVSFLVVRGAAIALMRTGLDEKRARFQSLSAFTGTGFTTKEAELVVNNPQRRRIITWLMIMGNAGLATVIVTATSSLVTSDGYHVGISAVIIVVGIYIIHKIVSRNAVIRRWEKFIEKRLIKSASFEEATAEDLLHLGEGYSLVRITITPDSPYIGSTLSGLGPHHDKVWVLGIERGFNWIPMPSKGEVITEGDKFVIYGQLSILNQMFAK